MELVWANVIFVYMRIPSIIRLIVLLLAGQGAVHATSLQGDTTAQAVLAKAQWELVRAPATFEPAGWQSLDALALTRVQAVKMGLTVNDFVDERFDPVKGKQAASRYYGKEIAVTLEATIKASPGTVLLSAVADEAQIKLRDLETANPHLTRDVLPKGAALYGIEWMPSSEDWTSLIEEQTAVAVVVTTSNNDRNGATTANALNHELHGCICGCSGLTKCLHMVVFNVLRRYDGT